MAWWQQILLWLAGGTAWGLLYNISKQVDAILKELRERQ